MLLDVVNRLSGFYDATELQLHRDAQIVACLESRPRTTTLAGFEEQVRDAA